MFDKTPDGRARSRHARLTPAQRSVLVSASMERLLDNVAILVPVRDGGGQVADLRIKDANEAAARFIGAPLAELTDSSVTERFPELPLGEMMPAFQAILDRDEPTIFESVQLPGRFAGAARRSFDVRVVPLDGSAIVVTWRDVGDLVRPDPSRAPSRDRFQKIAERSSDIVVEVGADCEIRWISPSAEGVLGTPPSALAGTYAPELVAPEDREQVLRDLHLLLSGLTVDAQTFRLLTAAGRRIWVSAHAEPLFDLGGGVQAIVMGMRRCQEEVVARRALETTSSGLAALMQAERGRELVFAICSAAVDKGGYLFAWYAEPVPDGSGTALRCRCSSPADTGFLDGISIACAGTTPDDGRLVVSDSRPTIVNDIDEHGRSPWGEHLARAGFRSLLALPVHVGDTFIGVFGVLAGEAGAFDGGAVHVLQDLASAIGLGLGRLRERRRLDLKSFEYQRLAENASDVVYESDSRGIFVWVSPSVEQLLGWTPAELLGTRSLQLIAPADQQRALQVRRRVSDDGLPAELDLRLLHKQGHFLWVSARVQPIKDELGTVVSFIFGLRNSHEEITTRRALQTMSAGISVLLHAEEERALLDAMCAAAVDKGGYLFATYGRPTEGAGRSIQPVAIRAERAQGDGPAWDQGSLSATPAETSLRTGKTSLVRNFETEVPQLPWKEAALARGFRSSISLPVFVNGALDGAFMVYSNEVNGFDARAVTVLEDLAAELGYGLSRIRERVRLDEAIAERDRARTSQEQVARQLERLARLESLGQLAGGIAHDFNNLLTVVMSYASLAQNELNDVRPGDATPLGRVRTAVDQIAYATEQAGQLTHQLLTFAKREPARPQHLDLNEVVSSTVMLLERIIEPRVRTVTRLSGDLAPTRIDSGRMTQVIMNLAMNASDAMRGGGTLIIETDMVGRNDANVRDAPGVAPGEYIRLRVRDSGTGMPVEVRDRAFEPFFTTKPVGRGTGLGLATVYGIVTQAGGHVAIESEPGRGTTITILLPVSDEAAAPPQPAPAPAPGGRETVLIVEDEPELLTIASAILGQRGYRVLPAPSGELALEILDGETGEVHLLLTDIQMPGILGTELATHFHARWPDAKILFMSGYADTLRTHTLGAGAASLLKKPFGPESLLRAVDEVLGARR